MIFAAIYVFRTCAIWSKVGCLYRSVCLGFFVHLLCLFFDFYFLNNVLNNAVASVAQEYISLLSKIAERLDFLGLSKWSVWIQTLVWFHTKARQSMCAIYQFLLLFLYIISFETVRFNINLQECCKLASLKNSENREKPETCMRISLTKEVRASGSQLLGSSCWPGSLWASLSQE